MALGWFNPHDFFPWSLAAVYDLEGFNRTCIHTKSASITAFTIDMDYYGQFGEILIIDKIHFMFSL